MKKLKLIVWVLLLVNLLELNASTDYNRNKAKILSDTNNNGTTTSKRRSKSHSSSKSHKRQQKSALTNTIKLFNFDEPDFDYKTNQQQQLQPNNINFEYPLGSTNNDLYYDSYQHQQQNVQSTTTTKTSFTVNITATIGHNVVLPCAVRNLGVHNILWLRVRDGDVLAFDDMLITQDARFKLIRKGANESNLMIEGVRVSDSGEYACQINTYTVKSKLINLIILTPPAFSDIKISNDAPNYHDAHMALTASLVNNIKYPNQPTTDRNELDHMSTKSIDVVEGKPVYLECHAYGQPIPTINWYVKRYKSENLTIYSLNSTFITVNNVQRKQFDYFECEATNKVPPSISKKFKINVLYRPEVVVSPPKVFIYSMPTQVKFNCTVSSHPESNIIWMFDHMDLREKFRHKVKKMRQTLRDEMAAQKNRNTKKRKKDHQNKTRHDNSNSSDDQQQTSNTNTQQNEQHAPKTSTNKTKSKSNRTSKHHHGNSTSNRVNRNLFLNASSIKLFEINEFSPSLKFKISELTLNDTHKISSILINVENEFDLGTYECFANNTAGSKSVKFHIYGDNLKSKQSTATANIHNMPNIETNQPAYTFFSSTPDPLHRPTIHTQTKTVIYDGSSLSNLDEIIIPSRDHFMDKETNYEKTDRIDEPSFKNTSSTSSDEAATNDNKPVLSIQSIFGSSKTSSASSSAMSSTKFFTSFCFISSSFNSRFLFYCLVDFFKFVFFCLIPSLCFYY